MNHSSICNLILLDGEVNSSHPGIQAMAAILGPCWIMPLDEFIPDNHLNRILICASSSSGKKLMHFVLKNLPALSNRTVGLINLGENCAEPGWIPDVVAMLGCSGHNAVAIAMNQPIETFVDYALAFNSSQHKPTSDLARRKLKEHIEEFLAENSILVLSTCFREKSFSAILRYCYHEGHVFCLSQGGEFFAGIAQKSIVTFTVSSPLPDEYISCTGSAVLIHPYHESYNKTINSIKLQMESFFSEQVPPMIIDIHLREVQISKREFKVRGFQNPQIFHF